MTDLAPEPEVEPEIPPQPEREKPKAEELPHSWLEGVMPIVVVLGMIGAQHLGAEAGRPPPMPFVFFLVMVIGGWFFGGFIAETLQHLAVKRTIGLLLYAAVQVASIGGIWAMAYLSALPAPELIKQEQAVAAERAAKAASARAAQATRCAGLAREFAASSDRATVLALSRDNHCDPAGLADLLIERSVKP